MSSQQASKLASYCACTLQNATSSAYLDSLHGSEGLRGERINVILSFTVFHCLVGQQHVLDVENAARRKIKGQKSTYAVIVVANCPVLPRPGSFSPCGSSLWSLEDVSPQRKSRDCANDANAKTSTVTVCSTFFQPFLHCSEFSSVLIFSYW